jgi:multicomponent Na+:H+ antiporter subunit D
VLLGLLSAGLAVVVAVVALYPPTWARRPVRALRPMLTGLHRLHSGHIGDYAAWLVFGAAAIAALMFAG